MSNRRKTLLIFTPGFAADETDSTCIPMQQSFIKTLNKKYPDLDIIIFAFDYPYSKRSYNWFGNSVVSFNGQNKGGIRRWMVRRALFNRLHTIHATHDLAGVLSFWYGECALMGQRFSELPGINHFCWLWGQDVKKKNKYVKKVKMEAGRLIAFSDFLQDEFEKNHGIRPAHVITPGIDCTGLPTSVVTKDIDILAAGSLIPLKGYDVFIRVVAELKQSIPSIKAVLIGAGPGMNALQKLIEISGLQKNIILPGELPHPEVLQYMKRAKVFLHPSSYEGFGIVCLEALACSCKVISFTKPMKEKIKNWYVVNNKGEMIEQSIALLQSDQFTSVVPFTIEDTVERMARLFSLSE